MTAVATMQNSTDSMPGFGVYDSNWNICASIHKEHNLVTSKCRPNCQVSSLYYNFRPDSSFQTTSTAPAFRMQRAAQNPNPLYNPDQHIVFLRSPHATVLGSTHSSERNDSPPQAPFQNATSGLGIPIQDQSAHVKKHRFVPLKARLTPLTTCSIIIEEPTSVISGRARVPSACEQCSQSKRRCTLGRPCRRCRKHGLDCKPRTSVIARDLKGVGRSKVPHRAQDLQ